MTSKVFLSDQLFNLLVLVYCTCTSAVYTQAHSVHRNTEVKALLTLWWGRALEGTITWVPANTLKININSNNGNTPIKADLSQKRPDLIKNF